MAEALILYWSLTGTTLRVAESVVRGLQDERVDCVLWNLCDGLPSGAVSCDVVGIGFPVHWFRPPAPVSDAISALGSLDGMSVFTFAVNGTYRGAALNRARAAVIRAGGRELGAFGCHGEDNFYPYLRLGAQFSPNHPTKSDLDAAYEFGRQMAVAHLGSERGVPLPQVPPFDPPMHPLYALERFVVGPRLTRHAYSRLFRANPARCSRCGRCAKRCPVHNIEWEQAGLPSWGRECILCLQCVGTCPEEAVNCPIDWVVFKPFIRWNVHRAWRDSQLDRARVEIKKGRITRLEHRDDKRM